MLYSFIYLFITSYKYSAEKHVVRAADRLDKAIKKMDNVRTKDEAVRAYAKQIEGNLTNEDSSDNTDTVEGYGVSNGGKGGSNRGKDAVVDDKNSPSTPAPSSTTSSIPTPTIPTPSTLSTPTRMGTLRDRSINMQVIVIDPYVILLEDPSAANSSSFLLSLELEANVVAEYWDDGVTLVERWVMFYFVILLFVFFCFVLMDFLFVFCVVLMVALSVVSLYCFIFV